MVHLHRWVLTRTACQSESGILNTLCDGNTQGDHLSGKPGNVREFETCQGNVRDVVNSQGIVREKNLSWKSVISLAFPSKTVHSYIYT